MYPWGCGASLAIPLPHQNVAPLVDRHFGETQAGAGIWKHNRTACYVFPSPRLGPKGTDQPSLIVQRTLLFPRMTACSRPPRKVYIGGCGTSLAIPLPHQNVAPLVDRHFGETQAGAGIWKHNRTSCYVFPSPRLGPSGTDQPSLIVQCTLLFRHAGVMISYPRCAGWSSLIYVFVPCRTS